MRSDYISDGNAIYRKSFAIIRSEADLTRFDAHQAQVAVRMIHAAGAVDLAADIEFSTGLVPAARTALAAGVPILTDVNMVASGVTRKRLPADNAVQCFLQDPRTAGLATQLGTTRSAAAVELWRPLLHNAIVAIGNAPTALFYLLDLLATEPDLARPAAILGIPVGFVGAAESKEALAQRAQQLGTEFLTVRGRRGGSAITCAAINALATEKEIL
ncbi:MAG: precorrin-8X methylmutase [Corynebacterium sp.]|nr:precorrin-8X methylmutase [Corynebacterium sp.]